MELTVQSGRGDFPYPLRGVRVAKQQIPLCASAHKKTAMEITMAAHDPNVSGAYSRQTPLRPLQEMIAQLVRQHGSRLGYG